MIGGLSRGLVAAAIGQDASARYTREVHAVCGSSLIAHWPLDERTGTVARDTSGNACHGAYTGVDLGQAGIGDGRRAPYFPGASSGVNIYSAGLATAFNGAAGWISLWGKVAPGAWTDGKIRIALRIAVDANNWLWVAKGNTNNNIAVTYMAGATSVGYDVAMDTLDWFHIGLTWDHEADEVRIYLYGVQQGPTITGLGVWAGAPAPDSAVIGAHSTGWAAGFSGWLAHVTCGTGALTPTQMALIGGIGG